MDGEIVPSEVAPALRAGVLRLARRLRVERDRSALSNAKVAVLSHLARVGESTPLRVSREERQQPQSLTRVFAELEAGGLIDRRPDGKDGRQSVLTLTETGRASLAADMALRDRWLSEALTGLSTTELGVLVLAAGIIERIGETSER
ncbi:MarR family winged helix-turn-helix transcriptional regulator [Streptomyces cocklensis]|jgi:DNA-binding MarR family transcriptional regulator|uniref:Transcriptional regulator, MarR family n=1 Tax=Actinacidiphila cocklensis TaxID=887465 RepID=A0A9W4GPW2_9ACTN|nr:MarR family winged helix-turn-helix transcriptional regulator [Actinacidiphila cocklensis]MDD1062474.1 MarR family winged helix-turn-helix transcriptional regulator [Actinacidiphila cocklensis]WSX72512.1 MarR family winged helix-turn-helix transcriptional regulator [Streptomyces sp. NBC_00899]WSX81419.1 MarR family winged helix-turn-helix transcriptional regulator [Streptomyces sp. NBC_00899]CAG6391994.1 Transcriptional regulator, MarR family [Actinacidiphila cocklensis]